MGKGEGLHTRAPSSTVSAHAGFGNGCSGRRSVWTSASTTLRRSILTAHIQFQLLAFTSTVAHVTTGARTAIGIAAGAGGTGALGGDV